MEKEQGPGDTYPAAKTCQAAEHGTLEDPTARGSPSDSTSLVALRAAACLHPTHSCCSHNLRQLPGPSAPVAAKQAQSRAFGLLMGHRPRRAGWSCGTRAAGAPSAIHQTSGCLKARVWVWRKSCAGKLCFASSYKLLLRSSKLCRAAPRRCAGCKRCLCRVCSLPVDVMPPPLPALCRQLGLGGGVERTGSFYGATSAPAFASASCNGSEHSLLACALGLPVDGYGGRCTATMGVACQGWFTCKHLFLLGCLH